MYADLDDYLIIDNDNKMKSQIEQIKINFFKDFKLYVTQGVCEGVLQKRELGRRELEMMDYLLLK